MSERPSPSPWSLNRWTTTTFLLAVLLGLLSWHSCGERERARVAEARADSVGLVADSVTREARRDSISAKETADSLSTARAQISTLLRELRAEREEATVLRDSALEAALAGVSDSVRTLVRRRVQEVDALHAREKAALRDSAETWRREADAWRDALASSWEGIGAQRESRFTYDDAMEMWKDAAGGDGIGLPFGIEVPEWVGYVGAALVGVEVGRRLGG